MAKVWNLQHSKLNKVFPVPSDIDIVKAHKCKPIRQLAEEIGLKEYELYGDYKAKVTAKVPKNLSADRGKYVIVCGELRPIKLFCEKQTQNLFLTLQASLRHRWER